MQLTLNIRLSKKQRWEMGLLKEADRFAFLLSFVHHNNFEKREYENFSSYKTGPLSLIRKKNPPYHVNRDNLRRYAIHSKLEYKRQMEARERELLLRTIPLDKLKALVG